MRMMRGVTALLMDDRTGERSQENIRNDRDQALKKIPRESVVTFLYPLPIGDMRKSNGTEHEHLSTI